MKTCVHITADTSIAELIKEVTDSDSFMENLRAQQGNIEECEDAFNYCQIFPI